MTSPIVESIFYSGAASVAAGAAIGGVIGFGVSLPVQLFCDTVLYIKNKRCSSSHSENGSFRPIIVDKGPISLDSKQRYGLITSFTVYGATCGAKIGAAAAPILMTAAGTYAYLSEES